MPYAYSPKTALLNKILEIIATFYLLPYFAWRRLSKKRSISKIRKILLVEPFQMGDALSLLGMIRPLQRHYPDAQIYVLTKPSSGAILNYAKGITQVLTADFLWSDYGHKQASWKRLWQLWRYLRSLRKQNFDLGIDTRGDVRSQIVLHLTRCTQVLAYKHYLGSNILLKGYLIDIPCQTSPYLHRYEWNNYLLSVLGIPKEELVPIQLPTLQTQIQLSPNPALQPKMAEPYILIHIGGGWEYKRWQIHQWVQLIQNLQTTQKQNIIVIGGKGEQADLQAIEQQFNIPNDKIICWTTTLDDLITLVQNCHIFVGLDSGPMNLAVCLGKKVVALFGPGDSAMWFPYTPQSRWIHHKENYPCNPCFQKKCFYAEHNCMASIAVAEVKKMIADLVSNYKK